MHGIHPSGGATNFEQQHMQGQKEENFRDWCKGVNKALFYSNSPEGGLSHIFQD